MARLKVLNRLLSPWLGRGAIRFSALKLIHRGPTVRAGGLRVCCQGTKICCIRHRIHHNASSTDQNGQGSNDPEPYMLSNLQSAIAICCVQERVMDWYPWYKSQGTIHSLMRAKPWNQNLVVPLPAPGCFQSSFPKYPPQLIVFQEKRTWLPPRLWKPSSLRFVWQTHQSGNLGTQSKSTLDSTALKRQSFHRFLQLLYCSQGTLFLGDAPSERTGDTGFCEFGTKPGNTLSSSPSSSDFRPRRSISKSMCSSTSSFWHFRSDPIINVTFRILGGEHFQLQFEKHHRATTQNFSANYPFPKIEPGWNEHAVPPSTL